MIIQLVGTAVKISEVLYLGASKRTPKRVLQLYNVTWLHHELCAHFLHSPTQQTRAHLFRIYLHDLPVHAAPQYQIVCLRSTNSESQERLFSQAKQTSLRATNRKPENVLPTVLLSLQAKKEVGRGATNMKAQDSMVATVAKNVPAYSGTVVKKTFIKKRLHSWQAHLERISPTYSTVTEFGGAEIHLQPIASMMLIQIRIIERKVLHYNTRDMTLPEVHKESTKIWQDITESQLNLPTTKIWLYKADGTYMGSKRYPLSDNDETMLESDDEASPENMLDLDMCISDMLRHDSQVPNLGEASGAATSYSDDNVSAETSHHYTHCDLTYN